MNSIKVSVIVITYNHEKYILEALNGIAKQKVFFDYEVIIHDDASTDDTQALIKQFVSEHPEMKFKLILQTENQYSKKIKFTNKYIYPLVEGEYMIVCEGDDYWIDPDKLQKQADIMDSHPECVATGHNCLVVDENGKGYEKNPYRIYGPFKTHIFCLDELAFGSYPGQTATLLIRANPYLQTLEKHVDAFHAIRANGDKKKITELLLNGSIYYLEDFMSAYRVVLTGGDSWSNNNYKKNRLYQSYVDAKDCRKYAWEVYKIRFHNEFQIFYVAMKAILSAIKKPTEENKNVAQKIIREEKNIFLFLIKNLWYGFSSMPRYIAHRIQIKKLFL